MNFSSRTRQRRVASISMRARGEAWPQGGGMARGGAPLACLFLCLFLPGKARGRGRDRGGGKGAAVGISAPALSDSFCGTCPQGEHLSSCLSLRCATKARCHHLGAVSSCAVKAVKAVGPGLNRRQLPGPASLLHRQCGSCRLGLDEVADIGFDLQVDA